MAVLIKTEFDSKTIGVVSNADWFSFHPGDRESYRYWAEQARKGHGNPCFAHRRNWKAYAIPAAKRPKISGRLAENDEGEPSFERFESPE